MLTASPTKNLLLDTKLHLNSRPFTVPLFTFTVKAGFKEYCCCCCRCSCARSNSSNLSQNIFSCSSELPSFEGKKLLVLVGGIFSLYPPPSSECSFLRYFLLSVSVKPSLNLPNSSERNHSNR